jgi:hypothetical protein
MTITLRKLTWKSKWDFNKKYPEHYTLLDVYNHKPSSLVWLYYTHEKITFVDEVWNEIKDKVKGLKDIPKPGMDKDFLTQRFGGYFTQKSYGELKKIITAKKLNGEVITVDLLENFKKKKSERGGKMWSSEVYTKATLQGQNHNRLKI